MPGKSAKTARRDGAAADLESPTAPHVPTTTDKHKVMDFQAESVGRGPSSPSSFSFSVPYAAWEAVTSSGRPSRPDHPNSYQWYAGQGWTALVLPQLRSRNAFCRFRSSGLHLRFRVSPATQRREGTCYAKTAARIVCRRKDKEDKTSRSEPCDVKYRVRIQERPEPGQDVRFDVEQSGREPCLNHATPRPLPVVKPEKIPKPPPTLRHSFWVPFEAWEAVAKAGRPTRLGGPSTAEDWWRAGPQWKALLLPQLRALNKRCRLDTPSEGLRFRAPDVRRWKQGSYAYARLRCQRDANSGDGSGRPVPCDVEYRVRILELPKPGARVRFDVEQRGGEQSLRHPLTPPETFRVDGDSSRIHVRSAPEPADSRYRFVSLPWGLWDAIAKSSKPTLGRDGRPNGWRLAGRCWKDWALPLVDAANPFCRVGAGGAQLRFRDPANDAGIPATSGAFALARLLCKRKRELVSASGASKTVPCDVSYALRLWEWPREGEDVTFVLEQSGGDPSQRHSTTAEKRRSLTGARQTALLEEVKQFPGGLIEFIVGKQLEGVQVPNYHSLRQLLKRKMDNSSDRQSKSLDTRPQSDQTVPVWSKKANAPNIEMDAVQVVTGDEKSANPPIPTQLEELIELEEAEESPHEADASFKLIEELSESTDENMNCEPSQTEAAGLCSIAQEFDFDDNVFEPDCSPAQKTAAANVDTSSEPFEPPNIEEEKSTNLRQEKSLPVEVERETALGDLCSDDESDGQNAKDLVKPALQLKPISAPKTSLAKQFTRQQANFPYLVAESTAKSALDNLDMEIVLDESSKAEGLKIDETCAETHAKSPEVKPMLVTKTFKMCTLCSSKVSVEELETHLRLELGYFVFRCRLCPASFTDRAQAELHFRSLFAAHPGAPVSYAEHRDLARERRLHKLLKDSKSL